MSDRRVWEVLFEAMPLTALLRNLATLTRLGVIAPMSEGARRAAGRLTDEGELAGARIHPIAILAALTATGPGLRGQHAWLPAPAVADALDAAFGKSFAYAPQTGRRFYPGIDVSGSMGWGTAAGVAGLTPRMGAAAMAMPSSGGRAAIIWRRLPTAGLMRARVRRTARRAAFGSAGGGITR